MKFVFSCGNAPGLPTGYGGQGILALEALQSFGDVTVLAWNLSPQQFTPFEEYSTEEVCRRNPGMSKIFETRQASSIQWSRIKWFCNPYHQFPTTIRKNDLNRMIAQVNADVFLALQDIFMFEPGPFHCLSAVWMPLHFLPVEHPTVMSLSDFDLQLPISGWGAMLLETLHNKNSLRHIEVVAHGRDIQIYNEVKRDTKLTRRRMGWPEDAFVVLLIASNSEESGRKAFDAQIQAYAKFARGNKTWLHIHSENARAYDIGRLLEIFCGFDRTPWIDMQDHRMRTHREASISGSHYSVSSASDLNNILEKDLVDMYHASDVLLAASCSEGCGVPILEAQLCGTPVVTTRATAMWEETIFGISVEPVQWIARMDFNSGWFLPNSLGIAKALKEIQDWSPEHKEALFLKAKPILIANYSNEAIIESFKKVLSKEVELNPRRKQAISLSSTLRLKIRLLQETMKEMDEVRSLILKTYKENMGFKFLCDVL